MLVFWLGGKERKKKKGGGGRGTVALQNDDAVRFVDGDVVRLGVFGRVVEGRREEGGRGGRQRLLRLELLD